MKADPLIDAIRSKLHSFEAMQMMAELISRELPRRTRDLRSEKGQLEELRRKAGRGDTDAWEGCGERIRLIDGELESRLFGRSRARDWIISAIAVVSFLMGIYELLHRFGFLP